ncbi:MAG: tetratricopeptide repeat protein, partial [Bdellovibrionia bacterium]
RDEKALVSYERASKDINDGRVVADAHLSLAEMHYKKSRWAQALSHYQIVTANKNSDSKGFALYRSAWTQFNMGEISSAKKTLIAVLSNPQNLSRSGSSQNQI